MRWVTRTFFCNQKIRFVILWPFSSFFFFLFASLGRLENLGEYVTLSVAVPLFLYLCIIYGKRWREDLKYRKAEETIHPTFTDLAKKENPKIQQVVIKDLPKKMAYSSHKEKIVLSRAFFTQHFSEQEIKALLYHEIFHTKTDKHTWRIMILFLGLWIGILCTFVFFPDWPYILLYFLGGFLCSLFLISFERMLWQSEFKADKEASKKASVDVVISALTKIALPEAWNCDSPRHPSINRRISSLQKRKPQT